MNNPLLVPLALGDAYGAGFEYAPQNLHLNFPSKGYIKHPKYNIGDGRYTDDTQMAAALAEHLILNRPVNRVDFAQSFLSTFKRDPREGYSGRVYSALNNAKTGKELTEILAPSKSQGNGACMRAAVLGFLKDVDTVLCVAAEQALATHDSVDGVESAQAIALASYGLRNGVSRFDLVEYLASRWVRVQKRGNDGMGGYTVWVALHALKSGKTLTEIMRNAVSYGGDTDTVAAIACGLASQCEDIGQSVPRALLSGLENGKWGLKYLRALDSGLISLSKA
jgi:ADP-ribosyl-[dinitrogen reductase] hydrolase